MFTGIVEHVGTLEGIEVAADVAHLTIDVGPVAEGVKLGDKKAAD